MFVKLFEKTLDSSIWLESPTTFKVWITFLLSMDPDGFCGFASVENLAVRANLKPCHVRSAVAILESPDKRSSGAEFEGRRIERVQGGWMVLNAKKYRKISSPSDLKAASQLVPTRSDSFQLVSSAQLSTNENNSLVVEAEAEADKTTTTPVVAAEVTKKKRRTRNEIFSPYPAEVGNLVNTILNKWPKVQPKDRAEIHFDIPMLAERVDGLLHQPNVTTDILGKSAEAYLSERKNYYRAPQFFFGPGKGEDSPPWIAYARMIVHKEQSHEVR